MPKPKRRRTRRPAGSPRTWTEAHVRRVFWRAGFGATAKEARTWSRRGKAATLDWLVADRPALYRGPAGTADGLALDPLNEFGHDKLWWLDRMVRTSHPLQEKMTLFWHDHFATRSQPTPLMLAQNETQRRLALGAFPSLLRAMAIDAALARFLSLTKSVKAAPNENFARELMELFTLGTGYTEVDVREASRALTGLRLARANGQTTGIVYDPTKHDDGVKTIFGATGSWGGEDVLRFCVQHPAHGPFLTAKLWDFFVGTPLNPVVRDKLLGTYVSSGLQLRPLVRAILARPELYANLTRPDMVKWPAVFIAGQLRTMGASVEVPDWVPLMASMGQTLFSPPSVAGWEWGPLWLSSNAMRARFKAASVLTGDGGPASVASSDVRPRMRPDQHMALALAAVGQPEITNPTHRALRRLIASYGSSPRSRERAQELQRSLRHLLIAGPDNQLC